MQVDIVCITVTVDTMVTAMGKSVEDDLDPELSWNKEACSGACVGIGELLVLIVEAVAFAAAF